VLSYQCGGLVEVLEAEGRTPRVTVTINPIVHTA
jgi:hypothetical protein